MLDSLVFSSVCLPGMSSISLENLHLLTANKQCKSLDRALTKNYVQRIICHSYNISGTTHFKCPQVLGVNYNNNCHYNPPINCRGVHMGQNIPYSTKSQSGYQAISVIQFVIHHLILRTRKQQGMKSLFQVLTFQI